MTREQATKLLDSYCMDTPPVGALERLLDIGDGSEGVRWVDYPAPHDVVLEDVGEDTEGYPDRYLVMGQSDLDAVIYGQQ